MQLSLNTPSSTHLPFGSSFLWAPSPHNFCCFHTFYIQFHFLLLLPPLAEDSCLNLGIPNRDNLFLFPSLFYLFWLFFPLNTSFLLSDHLLGHFLYITKPFTPSFSVPCTTPCLALLAKLPMMQPMVQLSSWAVRAHCYLMSIHQYTQVFFWQGCAPSLDPPACIDSGGWLTLIILRYHESLTDMSLWHSITKTPALLMELTVGLFSCLCSCSAVSTSLSMSRTHSGTYSTLAALCSSVESALHSFLSWNTQRKNFSSLNGERYMTRDLLLSGTRGPGGQENYCRDTHADRQITYCLMTVHSHDMENTVWVR